MTKSVMTPMDLDSVVKGKGKKKFSGSCYICGKVGHKSTECWSRDRVSNKGSGRNQNANVTSSGKGKSVGKGAEGAKGHPKGQGKSKGKGKGKWRGFRAADPPIPWSLRRSLEKRQMREQEKWWNSWTEDVEPKRELPLGHSWLEVRSWS